MTTVEATFILAVVFGTAIGLVYLLALGIRLVAKLVWWWLHFDPWR